MEKDRKKGENIGNKSRKHRKKIGKKSDVHAVPQGSTGSARESGGAKPPEEQGGASPGNTTPGNNTLTVTAKTLLCQYFQKRELSPFTSFQDVQKYFPRLECFVNDSLPCRLEDSEVGTLVSSLLASAQRCADHATSAPVLVDLLRQEEEGYARSLELKVRRMKGGSQEMPMDDVPRNADDGPKNLSLAKNLSDYLRQQFLSRSKDPRTNLLYENSLLRALQNLHAEGEIQRISSEGGKPNSPDRVDSPPDSPPDRPGSSSLSADDSTSPTDFYKFYLGPLDQARYQQTILTKLSQEARFLGLPTPVFEEDSTSAEGDSSSHKARAKKFGSFVRHDVLLEEAGEKKMGGFLKQDKIRKKLARNNTKSLTQEQVTAKVEKLQNSFERIREIADKRSAVLETRGGGVFSTATNNPLEKSVQKKFLRHFNSQKLYVPPLSILYNQYRLEASLYREQAYAKEIENLQNTIDLREQQIRRIRFLDSKSIGGV